MRLRSSALYPVLNRRNVVSAVAVSLTIAFACLCIGLSWLMLLVKSRKVRNSQTAELHSLEALSVLLAVVAHTALVGYGLTLRPSSAFMRLSSKLVTLFAISKGKSGDFAYNKDDVRPMDSSHERLLANATSPTGTAVDDHSSQAKNGRSPGATASVPFGKEIRIRWATATHGRGEDNAAGATAATDASKARRGFSGRTSEGNAGGNALQRRWLLIFIVALFITTGIHAIVHKTIESHHRQSQEIVLALVRCGVDAVVVMLFTIWCVVRVLRASATGNPRMQKIWNRIRAASVASMVVLVVTLIITVLTTLRSVDPLPHLRLCILQDHECDPCAAEGLQLNPMLQLSWLWPALTPRRLFTFYTGSDKCRDENWKPIAYLDEPRETLVVSATCADGSKPHIYLHRPENNELHGRSDFFIVEVRAGNKQYHKDLEAFYGTAEKARAQGVTVNRDPEDNAILSVELTPTTLHAVDRAPRTEVEGLARRSWPSSKVLEIPLGASATYMVRCLSMDYEEFYMFPMKSEFQLPPAAKMGPGHENVDDEGELAQTCEPTSPEDEDELARVEPAGNVLLLVLDAVSRQAVRRSLPRFAAWINDFHRRHHLGSGDGHIVVEPTAVTTLGISTAGNFAPMMTGTTWEAMGSTNEADIMNLSLFNLAKKKHGKSLHTAMTVGYCHDFMELMLGNREASSGYGGPLQGVDHYLYEPMCHLEYSGLQSNFQGPYSIVKRCIDKRHVHEHVFDYTEYLLRRQMRHRAELAARKANGTTCTRVNGGKPPAKFFFDLSYLVDGHEGTHSAIALVDEGLVAFMNRLEKEVRFFDDPLNTLVFASDHGNHMGHYFEFTYAGRYERTNPVLFYVIHPEVMRRIDLRKGRIPGEAMTNFLTRVKRLATPLDFYRTMGDLLGFDAVPFEGYQNAKVPPLSLFDARSGPLVKQCRDFSSAKERHICSHHYCVSKEDAALSVAFVDDY